MKRFSGLSPWLFAGVLFASMSAIASAPLKVCLISGSELYNSEVSLPEFNDYLEKNFAVECILLQATDKNNLPGVEALENCDVALFFTRRLEIEGEQLEAIKKYCRAGKPLVGIRTASHGLQNWLEFDNEVLGGSYHGHYKSDVLTKVIVAPGMEDHPILKGVGNLDSMSSLYRTHPIVKDATLVLGGVAPQGAQPLAWIRDSNTGRVFYTSLGSVEDFRNPSFLKLISNALFWCAKKETD